MSFSHKNPEYTINGQLGDRKGIMGEKGVTAGFKAAKKQGSIQEHQHTKQTKAAGTRPTALF